MGWGDDVYVGSHPSNEPLPVETTWARGIRARFETAKKQLEAANRMLCNVRATYRSKPNDFWRDRLNKTEAAYNAAKAEAESAEAAFWEARGHWSKPVNPGWYETDTPKDD